MVCSSEHLHVTGILVPHPRNSSTNKPVQGNRGEKGEVPGRVSVGYINLGDTTIINLSRASWAPTTKTDEHKFNIFEGGA